MKRTFVFGAIGGFIGSFLVSHGPWLHSMMVSVEQWVLPWKPL